MRSRRRGPGLAVAVLLWGLSCPASGAGPGGEGDKGGGQRVAKEEGLVKAVFVAPDGRRSTFMLEVAKDEAARERGLMFRRELAPDRGMLFVFPEEADHTFWMKNTYIPLDMIFIGSDFRVVGVIKDARPLTLEPRSVGVPSRYVVEVRAHTAEAKGIVPGTVVIFDPPVGEKSR